ncbi:MAG: LamG domain-containing protein [archaeon]
MKKRLKRLKRARAKSLKLPKHIHKHLHNPPKPHRGILFNYKIKFLVKRAQTGMEYILTYGWAVLIILFALSSLFYIGVFEPKTPNQCIINAPFICNDVKAYDDAVIYTISSKNPATVTDILVNGQSCSSYNGYVVVNNQGDIRDLNQNSQNEVKCTQMNQKFYKKASSEIVLSYSSDQGLIHSISGSSSANIEEGVDRTDYIDLGDPEMIFGLDFDDPNNGFNVNSDYGVSMLDHSNLELVPNVGIGQSAKFIAANGDFIEMGHSPSLNNDVLTVEFLVKLGDPYPPMERPIFVKEDATRFDYGFYYDEGTRKFLLKVRTTTTPPYCYAYVYSNSEVEFERWYHVVGTFDGNNNIGYLYIDGERAGDGAGCAPGIAKSAVGIFIGSDSRKTVFLQGTLDSIALYKKILSPDEVREHYEHFTPPS